MPDLLGEEGHEGAQQPKRALEHPYERGKRDRRHLVLRSSFAKLEPQLHQLEIPVAELAPEELVDRIGSLVEAVSRKSTVHLAANCTEASHDPLRLQRSLGRQLRHHAAVAHGYLVTSLLRAVDVHEQEPGGVPDLVRKSAVAFVARYAERNVVSRRSHTG